MPVTLQKIPPHSLEAESIILGSALTVPDAAGDIVGVLCEADFYVEANRKIFDAISALYQQIHTGTILTY